MEWLRVRGQGGAKPGLAPPQPLAATVQHLAHLSHTWLEHALQQHGWRASGPCNTREGCALTHRTHPMPQVTEDDIDQFQREYRGGAEERGDVLRYYERFQGDMDQVGGCRLSRGSCLGRGAGGSERVALR